MNVPHPDKIIHQTFNSKKLEFVWLFDDNIQFILNINKNGFFYIEAGKVITPGDYIDSTPSISYRFAPHFIIQDLHNFCKENSKYNFFSNGKDLVPLIKDVIDYLK